MASAGVEEKHICSICQNISTDPLTLRSGHNFCWVCIDRVLDTQEEPGAFSCPDCRDELQELPAPSKDITPCNTAEHFPYTEQDKTPMFCTNCLHSPVPAVKTCQLCEASLCDDHLRVHSKSAGHVITEPTSQVDNRKCSIHNKVLEYYCYEDAVCICVYCVAEKHRTHQLEPLGEAIKKRKENLQEVLENLTSKRGETERRLQGLLGQKNEIPNKVDDITEKVTALFRDSRRQLDDLEKRVLSEISRQEERVSLQVSDLIRQLEIKKDELSMKMSHIEELCNMTDPLTVLNGWGSDLCDTKERDYANTEDVDKMVPSAGDMNEILIALTIKDGLENIVTKTRKHFNVPEVSDILLDLNTAANNVAIPSDLKSASWSVMSQRRQESPERFHQYQVLSIKGFFTGQHYWEVETSESEYWMVGMTYPSTQTKGDQSWIGNNNKSWSFCRWYNEYSIRHDSKDIELLSEMTCNRYGIYMDYEAGRLSFYELCDPIRQLHTFTATFTEPLHAAFWVEDNGWIKIRR